MKIKRKVQKNLPQLIEWLLKSGYRNYTANSNMGNTVTLSRGGAIQFLIGTFFPEETFTVEVEEEITEDTVIPKLVEIYKIIDKQEKITIHENSNIYSNVDSQNSSDFKSFAFYILNDDYTMTLIWRDGRLVE
ncbi:hypothetical protein [Staphylococcus sp. ZWU0021]|uniref:hypothetical protein n=1 Tax=Staphylococcus sp. ZWU0021 TaxID=1339238 RepID=UPI0006457563|nr:hypothetical protein [Staphylococcus sp. ZWU0021]